VNLNTASHVSKSDRRFSESTVENNIKSYKTLHVKTISTQYKTRFIGTAVM